MEWGDAVERLEPVTVLSATVSGLVATVPEAKSRVDVQAKPPADFTGLTSLTGDLGPGTCNVTQNGADVTVVLGFTQHPEYNGLTLEGTVKGKKLKSYFEGNHNGIGRAWFHAKVKKDGSFRWTLWDSPVSEE